VYFFLICVFHIRAANFLEGVKSWCGRCVGVDVEDVGAFDLLEESHRGVPLVVFHHRLVGLSLGDVVGWVLEDASCSVGALARVIKEILAYRCEVLPAQGLLLLKLFLTVGETASLLLHLVLTLLALQPEFTQFGLDLLLPSILQWLTVFLG